MDCDIPGRAFVAYERSTVGSIAFHYERNIWHQQSQMQTTMSALTFFLFSLAHLSLHFASCYHGFGILN